MGEQFGTTKTFVHLHARHVGDMVVSGPVEISDLLQLMHFLLERELWGVWGQPSIPGGVPEFDWRFKKKRFFNDGGFFTIYTNSYEFQIYANLCKLW